MSIHLHEAGGVAIRCVPGSGWRTRSGCATAPDGITGWLRFSGICLLCAVSFPIYWANFSNQMCGYFIAADTNGFGGCPMTNVAPGIGYPTGWNPVSVIWGPTQSLGRARQIRSHGFELPEPAQDTEADRTEDIPHEINHRRAKRWCPRELGALVDHLEDGLAGRHPVGIGWTRQALPRTPVLDSRNAAKSIALAERPGTAWPGRHCRPCSA